MVIEFKDLWRGAALLVLAGITMLVAWKTKVPDVGTDAGVIMKLPYWVGSFSGRMEPVSQAEKLILPADTEFERKTYISSIEDRILCSIVLSGAEKRSIHRPEICLPGQGWTVKAGEVVNISLKDGRVLPVMNLHLERQIRTNDGKTILLRSYYMYWFVGNGVSTPYHSKRVFLTSWDRLVYSRSHRWAYVIVSSIITEGLKPMGKNDAETLGMLKSFIGEVAPEIMQPSVVQTLAKD